MVMPLSPVRSQLLFKRGAYMLWKSIYGAMPVGVQCGYAVTCFDSELELRSAVTHYKYSELIKRKVWKVGTAAVTAPRHREMFFDKRPLLKDDDIWWNYWIPFDHRLTQYSSDVKKLTGANCDYTKNVLVKKYIENSSSLAILMIPLIIGFDGTSNSLELEMSKMLVDSGAEVHNDKAKQAKKVRAKNTSVNMKMTDVSVDKMLKLTPTLRNMGFEIHPDKRKRK